VSACWWPAPRDDAITAVKIGEPLKKIVVEPVRNPVPAPPPREPRTAPPSVPERGRASL
jgi:hypothetical protein